MPSRARGPFQIHRRVRARACSHRLTSSVISRDPLQENPTCCKCSTPYTFAKNPFNSGPRSAQCSSNLAALTGDVLNHYYFVSLTPAATGSRLPWKAAPDPDLLSKPVASIIFLAGALYLSPRSGVYFLSAQSMVPSASC